MNNKYSSTIITNKTTALYCCLSRDDELQGDSNSIPFLNIINEWYSNDTSKKIRAVFMAKGESSKPLCTKPPYGYLKAPDNKHHWIVNEDAAKVVREIFKLFMEGYDPTQIANILTERKIENPTVHAKHIGLNPPAHQFYDDPYLWSDTTVTHILERMEYIGHTVNFKTYRKSYKNKKQMHNDPSEWQIFKNTHEAIVNEAVFEIVQKIHDGRRKVTPMGEMPILSGMLYCADCGAKLYQVRGLGWGHSKECFVCATYRKIKGGCSSHQIRNVVIEEALLDDIRRITAFAQDHEAEFVEMITQKTRSALYRSLQDNKRELEQSTQRIGKLDEITQRLYEENLEGKITNERFAKMIANYEAEQQTL